MSETSLFSLFDGTWVDNVFTTNNRHLAYWSHHIEEMAQTAQPGTILTGCQQFHVLEPRQDLYNRLAEKHNVSIFAQLDTSLDDISENIRLVKLDEDSELMKEWFVIVDTPDYQRGVIAREITNPMKKRLFRGALIHDPQLISRISNQLQENLLLPA